MKSQSGMREREFIVSNGLVLRADEAGPSSAAPMIFLHGGGQARASWQRAVLQMAERGFNAMTIDQRGHGQSDRGETYVMDAYVCDLADVVDQLDRNRSLSKLHWAGCRR